MSELYKQIEQCRACGNKTLAHVIDLGDQCIVDFPTYINLQADRAPLYLVICQNCHLVQLLHSVRPDRLYRTFWYRSGINESMRKALKNVIDESLARVEIDTGDWVMDIGCNDGTLLSMYPKGLQTCGIDPAENLAVEATERMTAHITDFASPEVLRHAYSLTGDKGFKIITAVAMFYDLEDPCAFLNACKEILAPNGVLVIQMNYLVTMLRDCAVDNICHEHLTYFSLTTMNWLAERCGFIIRDVETNDLNGGSLRVYMTQVGETLAGEAQATGCNHVSDLLEEEASLGLDTPGPYTIFADRVNYMSDSITKFIEKESFAGKRMYIYGASTRGTVTLQLLPEIYGHIAAACERDERKYGRWMVGGNIPIINEEMGRQNADYFLVLPWHFKAAILEREKEYAMAGGKFIFPLPTPRVVSWDDQAQTWVETML